MMRFQGSRVHEGFGGLRQLRSLIIWLKDTPMCAIFEGFGGYDKESSAIDVLPGGKKRLVEICCLPVSHYLTG